MQIDFLIVGQGLAGSLLAWELLKRKTRIAVVDPGLENASAVAAGIINPVTGMRFVKTADVDCLLPFARQCYAELTQEFNQEFYIDMPMNRIFTSVSERANAEKRRWDAQYRPYLGDLQNHQSAGEFNSPYGYIEQKNTGYLNTLSLLNCIKQYLCEQNSYIPTSFDYALSSEKSGLKWRDITASQVLFCEGAQIKNNPWFNWLPLQPVKGEILTLANDICLPEVIINFGHWLLPTKTGGVKFGATFERNHLDALPTPAGRRHLLRCLHKVSASFARTGIAAHQAGIRPCTLDKQPFLGSHPRDTRMAVFNGFGAKGSLQIPWYGRQFADFLIDQKPLPKTCDISRYESTCFPG